MDQVARRGDLRARHPARDVAARIGRRRVELQRGERKFFRVRHTARQSSDGRPRDAELPPQSQIIGPIAGPGRRKAVPRRRSNSVARHLAAAEARPGGAVRCWQSIVSMPRARGRRRPARPARSSRRRCGARTSTRRRTSGRARRRRGRRPARRRSRSRRCAPRPASCQAAVGVDHLGHDPGAGLAVARRRGAGLDDARGRRCRCAPRSRGVRRSGDRLAQRPRQPELGRQQHHARVGRPPEHRLAVAVPGEDALANRPRRAGAGPSSPPAASRPGASLPRRSASSASGSGSAGPRSQGITGGSSAARPGSRRRRDRLLLLQRDAVAHRDDLGQDRHRDLGRRAAADVAGRSGRAGARSRRR